MGANVPAGPDQFPVVIELDNESFEGQVEFNLDRYYARVFRGGDAGGERAQQVFSDNKHLISDEERDRLLRGETIQVTWSLKESFNQAGELRRVTVRRR
jgi:hypothetical protein